MMEEVSDDTNGESTFEFVGGKTDDSLLKDETIPAASCALEQPPSFPVVSTGASAPTFLPALPPQIESLSFPMSSPTPDQQISFYDPAQHLDPKTVVLPPLSGPFASPQVQSHVPLYQNQFTPVQQSYPDSDVSSKTSQTSPPLHHEHFAAQVQHSALTLPLDARGDNLQQESSQSGVWSWLKGKDFLNKVAEKAKNSVDSVITTLDPGMKEIINTGGDVNVIVASGNEAKLSAVREAFQFVFGKATVQGVAVQSSSIAPQPVGFSAGLKSAEERINNLRQQGFVHEKHILLAIENFVAELTPENWFDIGCLLLQDYNSGISLQVYTEAIPVSSHYISEAKAQTPSDFPLGWSGYAVTIGQIVGSALGVNHSEWHEALTGVSRREILFLAAKTIAGLYRSQLRR